VRCTPRFAAQTNFLNNIKQFHLAETLRSLPGMRVSLRMTIMALKGTPNTNSDDF